MNKFGNYCPNKKIICRYKDAPWMNDEIKRPLKKKANVYIRYVKNNFDPQGKQLLDTKILETSNLIIKAKVIKICDSSIVPPIKVH